MRFAVDLDKCENHGQCTFSAPSVFELDDDGELSFRHAGLSEYVSGDLDPETANEVEFAADVCPVQAIRFVE